MSTQSPQKKPVVYEFQRILAWHKKHNPWLYIEQVVKLPHQKASPAANTSIQLDSAPSLQWNALAELKAKIRENHQQIHAHIIE